MGDPTLRFPGALLDIGAGASGTEAGKAIGATEGINGATKGTVVLDDAKCSFLSSLANLIADLAEYFVCIQIDPLGYLRSTRVNVRSVRKRRPQCRRGGNVHCINKKG